jgi:hypothetical protein
MAEKTATLSQELIDDLIGMQSKANEMVVGIGQIHLKLRELKLETERLLEEQQALEVEFESNNINFTSTIRDLEKQYPMGEIDLNKGIVIFESEE